MNENAIFTMALGLGEPWHIEKVEFIERNQVKELHLSIGHKRDYRFTYGGDEHSVYDHQDRTWRHLNFFEHTCYLHARVPRIKLPDGKIKLVEVPWAKEGSSFTLLFEAYTAMLVKRGMSQSGAGRYVQESYKVVQRIIKTLVITALREQPLDPVKELGVDETSTKKGHKYFTVLTDRERKKVVGISEGKSESSLVEALGEMEFRGASKEKVRCTTMDMSKSYIKGVKTHLPQSQIVFDRYHIAAMMNKVVDETRKKEQREYMELKKTRYLWLKNHNNLTVGQQEKITYLEESYPTIGKVYRFKEMLRTVLQDAHRSHLLKPLIDWKKAAYKSEIPDLINFAKMMDRHWYGIKTYFKKLTTNAYAERVNLKIQDIKRTAKGYRNMENFKMMIYFHLGGLDLRLPTTKG